MAEILHDSGEKITGYKLARDAHKTFRTVSSQTGISDVHLLRFEQPGNTLPSYDSVTALWKLLTKRNDIGRLRRLRKVKVRSSTMNEALVSEWHTRQRSSEAELASKAGDKIAFYRWKLRRYAGDTGANALIVQSVTVLQGRTVTGSGLLLTMATFNLAKDFLIQKNTFDALAYAVMHHSLIQGQDMNAERSQRAELLVLEAVSQAFATLSPARQKTALEKLTKTWNGWLNYSTPERWKRSGGGVDEIGRFTVPTSASCLC